MAVVAHVHAERLKRSAKKVAQAQKEWHAELAAGKIAGCVSLTVYTDGTTKIHCLGVFERCESIKTFTDELIAKAEAG